MFSHLEEILLDKFIKDTLIECEISHLCHLCKCLALNDVTLVLPKINADHEGMDDAVHTGEGKNEEGCGRKKGNLLAQRNDYALALELWNARKREINEGIFPRIVEELDLEEDGLSIKKWSVKNPVHKKRQVKVEPEEEKPFLSGSGGLSNTTHFSNGSADTEVQLPTDQIPSAPP